jgi:Ca-activated chloride channel family protein
MKIKYGRYTGEDFGISPDDLLQALSDFLLQSGFNSNSLPFREWNQQTLEDLKNAIQKALESGELFDSEQMQEAMERLENLSQEQKQQLLDRLVQKMVD